VDESICIGCGVCAGACNIDAMTLRKRSYRVMTPESSLEKILISAVENGKLEQILFDGVRGPSADFLKTFVGAFLRMPAAKRLMLTKDVRSRFSHSQTMRRQNSRWPITSVCQREYRAENLELRIVFFSFRSIFDIRHSIFDIRIY